MAFDLQMPEAPAYVCAEIRIARSVQGLTHGDAVRVGQHTGRLLTFACVGDAPAAWVDFIVPGTATRVSRLVPVSELVKVNS